MHAPRHALLAHLPDLHVQRIESLNGAWHQLQLATGCYMSQVFPGRPGPASVWLPRHPLPPACSDAVLACGQVGFGQHFLGQLMPLALLCPDPDQS